MTNPEVGGEWGMYKSTTTEKVAYYCAQNGERNGPRDTTKSNRKEIKEKEMAIIKERQQGEQENGVEVGKFHPHLTSGNREGIKRDREETRKNKSECLLWTLRFDAEDWIMGKKWKDCYLLEEENAPPLQEMGIEEEAASQIALGDTERYEVAVVQGKRVAEARYRVQKKKQRQKEKRHKMEYGEIIINVGGLSIADEDL